MWDTASQRKSQRVGNRAKQSLKLNCTQPSEHPSLLCTSLLGSWNLRKYGCFRASAALIRSSGSKANIRSRRSRALGWARGKRRSNLIFGYRGSRLKYARDYRRRRNFKQSILTNTLRFTFSLGIRSMVASSGVPSFCRINWSCSKPDWPGRNVFRPRNSAKIHPTDQISTKK